MPSLSYIKSKLAIIVPPLISSNHHHNIPITRSITPLITQKIWSTFNATKKSLLFNNKNASFLSSSSSLFSTKLLTNYNMNNKCYFLFQCLFKGVKSHCTLPRVAALAAAMWIVRIERVPFSGYYHVVLRRPKFTWIPSHLRNRLSYSLLSLLCEDGKYKNTLSSIDPKVVRVMDTVTKIVKTMHFTFGLKEESIVMTYETPPNKFRRMIRLQLKYIIGSPKNPNSTFLGSTRKGKISRWYATKHLEGREWKVAVKESPEKHAALLPDCTIYITTGMIDILSEVELVLAIAHEIGHYIAQHRVDTAWWGATRLLIIEPIMMKLLGHLAPPYSPTSERWDLFDDFLISLHAHRREYEADYIGLMLTALAGYDPRIAVKFYEKDYFEEKKYMCTHPPLRKRMELLQNHEKMEKVMNAYMQSKADEEIKIKKLMIHSIQ